VLLEMISCLQYSANDLDTKFMSMPNHSFVVLVLGCFICSIEICEILIIFTFVNRNAIYEEMNDHRSYKLKPEKKKLQA